MDMQVFTDYVARHVRDYLPPRFMNAEVQVEEVQKLDEAYTGMTVRLKEQFAAPVVNLNNFFQHYQSLDSLDTVMSEIAKVVQMESPMMTDLNALQDYDVVQSRLFIRLSNAENAASILSGSPHRTYCDIVMTYHIFVECETGDGFMSARITDKMLNDYGISAAKLHQDALNNAPSVMKPLVQSIQETLTSVPDDNPDFLVITNQDGVLGAGVIFYEGVMEQVAERLGSDYYIIPSSVHEMLAVPDNGTFMSTKLAEMLNEANTTVVQPQEVLSHTIYHYDRKNRLFETADDHERRSKNGR